MPENLRISKDLIDAIDRLNTTPNNLGNLQNILKEILNCDIKILVNGNHLLTIKPYWIELYYYKDDKINCGLKSKGRNKGKPICDIHENKKYNNRLYFNERFQNNCPPNEIKSDRMDICLGDNGLYVSVLIKRANIYYSNGTIINTNFTDSTIAKIVKRSYMDQNGLKVNTNINFNDLKDLTYELGISNHVKLNDIKFCRRVNIVNNNEYAFYDSSKYCDVINIK